jgi:hypothetical protein
MIYSPRYPQLQWILAIPSMYGLSTCMLSIFQHYHHSIMEWFLWLSMNRIKPRGPAKILETVIEQYQKLQTRLEMYMRYIFICRLFPL